MRPTYAVSVWRLIGFIYVGELAGTSTSEVAILGQNLESLLFLPGIICSDLCRELSAGRGGERREGLSLTGSGTSSLQIGTV